MALVPGEVLAGTSYQVVREIGAGGMGVVYEVEHVRLRKRYVAKVIHEAIRGDEAAAKRMEREAHVLAEINHPNVVQVHDVGTTPDGTSYFIMEKLDGNDLRDEMKKGGMSTARAVGICVDILDALEHVHRRNIVHRDIKPENVFLARMPNGLATKVLDFGIVSVFDGERASQARITKTGGFVGTLYYAAPEQMQGKPPGPSNDVYACGLVLYELLAGRGPFDDDPGVGLSRCFKPAPRLAANERVPASLVDAVAASLEQDPQKRPNAGDFGAMLRQVLTLVPADPAPPAVRAQVDDLLANINLHPTAAPDTPLMGGAPVSPRSTIPINTHFTNDNGSNAPSPAAIAYAATLGSSRSSAPGAPMVDTSPGVASTINPSTPRASGLAMVGALAAAIGVLGLIGTAGSLALRSRANTANANAATAAAPPSVDAKEPTPVVEAAHAEPAAASVAPAAAPSAVAPVAAHSEAPTPSGSPAKPATPGAAHPAAKARGNAEKDGYVKDAF